MHTVRKLNAGNCCAGVNNTRSFLLCYLQLFSKLDQLTHCKYKQGPLLSISLSIRPGGVFISRSPAIGLSICKLHECLICFENHQRQNKQTIGRQKKFNFYLLLLISATLLCHFKSRNEILLKFTVSIHISNLFYIPCYCIHYIFRL